jgi:hypothetical protein
MPISKIGSNSLNSALTFVGQQTIPTINLTGGQITFPATAVPSADANTLDDYEEGTWIPTALGVSGSGSFSGISGSNYTKIGRLVVLRCYIGSVSKGTLSGGVRIGGFPFANNADYVKGSIRCNSMNSLTAPANWLLGCFVGSGQSETTLEYGTATGVATLQWSSMSTGDLMLEISYFTNS